MLDAPPNHQQARIPAVIQHVHDRLTSHPLEGAYQSINDAICFQKLAEMQ